MARIKQRQRKVRLKSRNGKHFKSTTPAYIRRTSAMVLSAILVFTVLASVASISAPTVGTSDENILSSDDLMIPFDTEVISKSIIMASLESEKLTDFASESTELDIEAQSFDALESSTPANPEADVPEVTDSGLEAQPSETLESSTPASPEADVPEATDSGLETQPSDAPENSTTDDPEASTPEDTTPNTEVQESNVIKVSKPILPKTMNPDAYREYYHEELDSEKYYQAVLDWVKSENIDTTSKAWIDSWEPYTENLVTYLGNVIYREVGEYNSTKPENEAIFSFALTGSVVLHRLEDEYTKGVTNIYGVIHAEGQYGKGTKYTIDDQTRVGVEECYEVAEKLLRDGPIGPRNLVFQAGGPQGTTYWKADGRHPTYFGTSSKFADYDA